MKQMLIVVLIVGVIGGLFGACSQKDLERFRDAPVGERNDSAADIVTMPDGFSNIATKCDHGNRIYATLHSSDGDGRGLTVVPADPTCVGT